MSFETEQPQRRSIDPRDDLILANKIFKVFCAGLRYSWTEEDIRQEFERFGKVISVIIPIKRDGTRPGTAIIGFEKEADARAAIHNMNGAKLKGITLHVSEFIEKAKWDQYKQERDRELDRYNDDQRRSNYE